MSSKYYESQQKILERMLSRISGLSTIEGSTTYMQYSPMTIELENVKLQLDEVVNRNNIVSAYENGYDEEVVKYAEEEGVDRKQANSATGKQTFFGTPNTIIPVGTKFGDEANGRMYETLLNGKIDITGKCTILSISCDKGYKYNANIGTLNYLPIAISGVTGTTNEEKFTGGTDEETIDDLYNRYLLKVRTPATSGNKFNYEQWALEVDGVGYAKCVPAEEIGKGGVVRVIIANGNKKAADEDLIKAVYKHIDSVRPILSGTLQVVTVTEIPIDITGNIELDTSVTLMDVQATFKGLVQEYFDDQVYKNKKISIAKIQAMLIDIDGVLDCSDIKINGNASNVNIAEEEIAVLHDIRLGVI